jgi:hypothetical protein
MKPSIQKTSIYPKQKIARCFATSGNPLIKKIGVMVFLFAQHLFNFGGGV